jgi:hypothetical protein
LKQRKGVLFLGVNDLKLEIKRRRAMISQHSSDLADEVFYRFHFGELEQVLHPVGQLVQQRINAIKSVTFHRIEPLRGIGSRKHSIGPRRWGLPFTQLSFREDISIPFGPVAGNRQASRIAPFRHTQAEARNQRCDEIWST